MDIDELKRLWRIAFGDSQQYTDFYFSRRFRPENTRTHTQDGHIVSAAQFVDYDITCGSHVRKGVYILGVCTHPDYRRMGYASLVIRQILDEQAARGVDLAFLFPAQPYLFAVYGKLGFVDLFPVYDRVYTCADIHAPVYDLLTPTTDELFSFYDAFHRALPAAVIKNRDDFQFAMDEVAASGGRIDVCGIAGEIRGFAATDLAPARQAVKELLCTDDAAKDTLLSRLFSDTGWNSVNVTTPGFAPGSVKRTLGMAKALRPGALDGLHEPYANLLLN